MDMQGQIQDFVKGSAEAVINTSGEAALLLPASPPHTGVGRPHCKGHSQRHFLNPESSKNPAPLSWCPLPPLPFLSFPPLPAKPLYPADPGVGEAPKLLLLCSSRTVQEAELSWRQWQW